MFSDGTCIPDGLIKSLLASSRRRARLREMTNKDLACALRSITADMQIFSLEYDVIEAASDRLNVWDESPESISVAIDLKEREEEMSDEEIEALISNESEILAMLKEAEE